MTFDVNADLRSVFTWNTKQLFVYVQAEYETQENRINEVVLWDSIVQQKASGGRVGERTRGRGAPACRAVAGAAAVVGRRALAAGARKAPTLHSDEA